MRLPAAAPAAIAGCRLTARIGTSSGDGSFRDAGTDDLLGRMGVSSNERGCEGDGLLDSCSSRFEAGDAGIRVLTLCRRYK